MMQLSTVSFKFGVKANLFICISLGSISGWTPGNEEEDIVINGEEINPQTNNML